MDKYFPIKTATACQLKWNWSTLFLYEGITKSCFRTGESKITPETFNTFHNTEKKQSERKLMLQGQWPEDSCKYCRDVENAGGLSDRLRHLTIPNQSPVELESDLNAVVVQPTILEVYFSNQCNLSCLYCGPNLSSKINAEYNKHGRFEKNGIILEPINMLDSHATMLDQFWNWMTEHSINLVRFTVAGGEGFYQPELETCLEYFESTYHPNLEFSILTNLTLPPAKLEKYILRFKSLISNGRLKRIDLHCSLDCLGTEQEYTRYGLKVDNWIANFERLMKERWLTLIINQTITLLTIKTMPGLIDKIKIWKSQRKIEHFFGTLAPGPTYLSHRILGNKVFNEDFDRIVELMPRNTAQDLSALASMQSIAEDYARSIPDQTEMLKLKTFLDETDRRRGTDWAATFPWLVKELQHVV